MKYSPTVFILSQILMSFITDRVMVEGAGISRARKSSLKSGNGKTVYINMFKHPTNKKKVVLMCHNKFYLVMINDKLLGSKNPKIIKKYGKWELQSFDVGIMRIYNVKERKFIAVDKNGRAYVTAEQNISSMDTYFTETQKNSLFVTYHSLVHRTLLRDETRKWYLAIKKDGKLKRPSKTYHRHRSTQFLSRDWGKYKQHLMNSR